MDIKQLNEELSRFLEEFSAQQLYLFNEINEEYKVKNSDLKNNLIHGKNYTIIDGGAMLLKNGFVDFSKVSKEPLVTNNALEKKCKNIIQDMKPVNKLSQEPVAIRKSKYVSVYVYKVDNEGYVCINEDYAKWVQKEKIDMYINEKVNMYETTDAFIGLYKNNEIVGVLAPIHSDGYSIVKETEKAT